MSQTPTTHIHLDEAEVAWIDDTNVKVIEVVLDKLAHGWSPEEIHFQHPDLSLSDSRRPRILLRSSAGV